MPFIATLPHSLTARPSLWQCDLIRRAVIMSNLALNIEEYDSMIYKLVTLES
jgi:hypothetical protein